MGLTREQKIEKLSRVAKSDDGKWKKFIMKGNIIKIKWGVSSKGETLYALGAVYEDLGSEYLVCLNQISRNTIIVGAKLICIDKRRVVVEATEEDIQNFKKCM